MKLDVTDIIRDHCGTLVDERNGKAGFWDWTLFLIIPLLLAGALTSSGQLLSDSVATVMITTLAIFAALLFNLLLLAHSVVRGTAPRTRADLERRLIQQIYANISYSILVSIVALVFLIFNAIVTQHFFSLLLSFVIYFLVANFLLTLVMVLKRIHVMLSSEFSLPGQS